MARNDYFWSEFEQGAQHKGALMHPGVGHCERRANNALFIDQQNIKIKCARCIDVGTFAAKALFDRLQGVEQVMGLKTAPRFQHGIKKHGALSLNRGRTINA